MTTDTIKALRDALELIRRGGSKEKSIDRIIFDVLALTADASEDAPEVQLDPVVEANREWLHRRSQFGIRKYGVTLADGNLSERELMTHALEEALDLSNYLQALLQKSARPAPVAATPAPDGWKLVPLEPDQRMIFAFLGEYHRPGGTERQCYRAMLAAAPAAPMAEVTAIHTRGGDVEPNAYDHLREQYESIFKSPSALASWRRKQTISGDVADEYVEMRVQFGWMAFQAGHRIASRHYAAEHAKPEPKFTPGEVAAHHHGESEPNQALSIEPDQVDHQQVATSAPGIAHANLSEGESEAWDAWEKSDEFKRWQNNLTSHVHFKAGYRAGQQAGAVDGRETVGDVERCMKNDDGPAHHWGGDAMVQASQICVHCRLDWIEYVRRLEVIRRASIAPDRRGPVEPHEPERRNGFDRRGRVAPAKNDTKGNEQ